MNTMLAKGMTVQSDRLQPGNHHYAWCVRCWWRSVPMDFHSAEVVAGDPDCHVCDPLLPGRRASLMPEQRRW